MERTIQNQLTVADKHNLAIFISLQYVLAAEVDSLIRCSTRHLAALRHNLTILYALSVDFTKMRSKIQRITAEAEVT